MTRMHSGGRGSSGSTKPAAKTEPRWLDFEADEVRDMVVGLARDGHDPSEIGRILRDQHGIPSVKQITGQKITDILDDEGLGLDMPEDLGNLVDKADSLQSHLEEHPKDLQTERQLELVKARVRKLASYHRDEGNIPSDWKYTAE
jgi:small subunit ribosomal protein S15